MSLQDDVATTALVVSLVALLVSTVQLLATLLGTAEGFKRTNRATMGVFVNTKRRILHLTELRIETTFSTPHFTFNTAAATTAAASQTEHHEKSKQRYIGSRDSEETKETKLLHLSRDGCKALPGFLRSNAQLSRRQVLRNLLPQLLSADESVLIRTKDRAYAAGWLLLIEQLCQHDSIHYTTSPGSYIYRSNNLNVFNSAELHLPAIQCDYRSWDLQPPAVSRPLASIELRDLLIICFRLRIRVQEYKEQTFRASGNGHTFSALAIQGAGLVVEYYHSASAATYEPKWPANALFAPTEATDQLAFGIIPPNPALGISRSWDLQQGDVARSMGDLWESLGISKNCSRILTNPREPDRNESREVFGDAFFMLVPILCLDGLGIIKYRPPIDGAWLRSTLWYRECRIVLRTRLNELRTNETEVAVDRQMIWVSDVLNELAKWEIFWIPGTMHHQFDHNAQTESQHKNLHFLRTTLQKADEFLYQTCEGLYTNLVAAHIEMATEVVIKAEQAYRDGKHQHFRIDNSVDNIHPKLSEMAHCYIDAALDGKVSALYHSKSYGRTLNDQQICGAWFTMLLRAILWKACHLGIPGDWVPYESRFYRDRRMIMIA